MTTKTCAAAILALSAGLFAGSNARADGMVQNAEAAQEQPSLAAKLVDAEGKAKKASATVVVSVKGVSLIDPASVNEQPKTGQGHLHYQVDDGPVIATTAPKLSFHGLKAGTHTITVVLSANDHTPLGPSEELKVTVP